MKRVCLLKSYSIEFRTMQVLTVNLDFFISVSSSIKINYLLSSFGKFRSTSFSHSVNDMRGSKLW